MSAATQEAPHGMPFPHPETPSSGFTAVNGEAQTLSSFRPAETTRSWRSLSGKSSPGENITVSTSLPAHGWRPDRDIREVTGDFDSSFQSGASGNKRKRSETEHEAESTGTDTDSRESPKRRHLSNILDSAVDLTSPDEEVERRQPGPGQTSRAASPLPNIIRGQGPPPPEVSSSAEARLVESAKQFQEAQRAESYQQQSPPYADDQYSVDGQTHDDADAKKRKRHFTNRTKTGCHTCRHRKKKCDERKPICANCERGHFTCGGYGQKPPDYKPPGQSRTVLAPQLQAPAKHYHDQQPPGPMSYWAQGEPPRNYPPPPPPVEAGRSYSHWGGRLNTDPAAEPKRASSRDSWPQPNWHGDHSHPLPPPQSPHGQAGPYYHPGYASLPPPGFGQPPHPHLPPPLHPPAPSQPAPPSDPWAPHHSVVSSYNYPPPPSSHHSSNNTHPSAGSGGTRRTLSEKEMMLRGQPFLHHTDIQLTRDRERCHKALFKYNNAALPNSDNTSDERAKFFQAILEPRLRQSADHKDHFGPIGDVGDFTLVESPFRCDYGYHIHLGKEVVIHSDCYLQDGGGIWIGDRVLIGQRVQLLTLAVSVDAAVRAGIKGKMKAGTIKIGEDAFIGAGAIVLPYVTIGKGAMVGAGSVVTRDVPENTVVRGNPATYIRRIDQSNLDRHHKDDLDTQEEKMRKQMDIYADAGWREPSPR